MKYPRYGLAQREAGSCDHLAPGQSYTLCNWKPVNLAPQEAHKLCDTHSLPLLITLSWTNWSICICYLILYFFGSSGLAGMQSENCVENKLPMRIPQ